MTRNQCRRLHFLKPSITLLPAQKLLTSAPFADTVIYLSSSMTKIVILLLPLLNSDMFFYLLPMPNYLLPVRNKGFIQQPPCSTWHHNQHVPR